MMATIQIPELSLVVLVGASSAGKSSFARRHFLPTEIVTSDFCRALVADDENDLSATEDAFAVLHVIAGKRLERGRLTVVDATSLKPEDRRPLVALSRQHHVLPVAIVFDLPEAVLLERHRGRGDRDFPPHVIRRQLEQLRRSLGSLQREGFRAVHVFRTPEEVDAATIARTRLWTDRRDEHGPFDLIGDVHGCRAELEALLARLGYVAGDDGVPRHPEGRKAIFLGDLVDRGPDTPGVLRIAMGMERAGAALCVPGNHDDKLKRALAGRKVQVTHGLCESLAQLAQQPAEFRADVERWLDGLVSHYLLDGGRLVVAHAGMKQAMQGRASRAVREFALYGETTGETDEYGLPVRYPWASEYRGPALVVYGHTPTPEPEWLNGTICIDTGCVFGGRLTALRYPERGLVSVPAAQVYYAPSRPFPAEAEATAPLAANERHDLLDVGDVLGKRIVATGLMGNVTVREENGAAALEVISRFAVDPRWLIYLPPTMSPCETSQREGLLEHPAEAFAYFRHAGVPRVVCEAKHMGSRAVVVVCRDAETAARRFGFRDGPGGEQGGAIYTRTGRQFFDDGRTTAEVLARMRAALDAAGFWERFGSDWFLLDCELLPWSAKASGLLREQYAATGAAARAAMSEVLAVLQAAGERGAETAGLLERMRSRAEAVGDYVAAYRRYCWPVRAVDDLRLAPFQLLASEGAVHTDKDHGWQMATLAELCRAGGGLLLETPYQVVDVTEPESEAAATTWWEQLVAAGGEGMVVKPFDCVARSSRGLVQPGVKCRGPEYLRIIYGPEYRAPEHLERLRRRGLSVKRGLALREFALGIEGLQRFVRGEPLYRVHECAFAVLALESEPIDPRL